MTQDSCFVSRRSLLAAAFGLAAAPGVRAESLPVLAVAKDPDCGCCDGWISHMRKAGFAVTVQVTKEMTAVKTRLSVPADLTSCHTAEIGGYVVEGHVPASAVRRLLAEKPDAIGLSAPGMPIGSPGMEGGKPETYEIVLFGNSGRRTYARFLGETEI
jgi:hypothetical protein